MAGIKLKDVNSSAKLLQALAKKADYDGDGKLTSEDIGKSATMQAPHKSRTGSPPPPPTTPTLDNSTRTALISAVLRAQAHSQFEVKEIVATIEDVRKKLVALDVDKNGIISDAELKKIKPDGKALAKALLAFADEHAGDK